MSQCLWNYIGTSAFADISYLMADVEAKFLYKNVLNTSQNVLLADVNQYSSTNAGWVVTYHWFYVVVIIYP